MLQPTDTAVQEIDTAVATEKEPLTLEEEEVQMRAMYNDMAESNFKGTEKEYLAHLESQKADESDDKPHEPDDINEGAIEEEAAQEALPDSDVDDLQRVEDADIIPPVDEPVETVESLKEQLQKSDDRYKSLDGKIEQRGRELADATQRLQEYDPFIKSMSDPNFRQHTLDYYKQPPAQAPTYDPEDPESVSNFIKQGVSNEIREQQRQQTIQQQQQGQRNFMNNWNTAVKKSRTDLIASGKDETAVINAIDIMTKSFMDGNVADIAFRYANFDKAIADAEQRGRTKVLEDIKNKQKQKPKRAVGETSSKSAEQKKSPHNMTLEEIEEELKTVDVMSNREELLAREQIKRKS